MLRTQPSLRVLVRHHGGMDEAPATDRPAATGAAADQALPQPPPSAAAPAQRPPSRANPSLGDILRSMVLLLALVGVIVAYQRFYTDEDVEFRAPVNVESALTQARDAAPYEVVGPQALPAGWEATSVRYTPGPDTRWHVGYLTPSQEYAGLEQTDGSSAELLEEVAPGAEPIGAAEVSGDTWRMLLDEERGDITLVRSTSDSVIAVTGSASQEELELLAGSLRTD